MSMREEKSCIIKAMGERLEEIQNNLGYTQEDMAEMMDVSKEQYRKYCKGKSEIPSHKLTVLHSKIDFDIKYVVTGKKGSESTSIEILSSMSEEKRAKYLKDIMDFLIGKVI